MTWVQARGGHFGGPGVLRRVESIQNFLPYSLHPVLKPQMQRSEEPRQDPSIHERFWDLRVLRA